MLLFLIPALLVVRVFAVLDVTVPEVPVVALFGNDTTLNCSFSTGETFNRSDISVFWQLTDTKRVVHSFYDGRDQLTDQGSNYINRTSLFLKELDSGNASLLLRGVQIADEGSFMCFVRIKEYKNAVLLLQVAASYTKPQVHAEPDSNLKPGDEVVLSCLSYGGYPQATLLWHDNNGRNLTGNATTSQVANKDGLFHVHSVLKVIVEADNSYSCLVKNEVLGEETHSSVTTTAGLNKGFPPVALWVTVGLAVCLFGLLIALAYIGKKKINESCKEGEAGLNAALLEETSEIELVVSALVPEEISLNYKTTTQFVPLQKSLLVEAQK
ncbi:CD276 antigen isoform X1 [Lepisosteus oculatus]|uniref:CD276 antigen isoform X1 n=1 Tax=Lepisosteus oculatus TaxID=7918 RepID=UPI0007401BC0|nr:PREDICTED: CD276 antigen isoform X1 [Lepisosteus oculatus]XP_015199269.1 PREDICTED: CD276 antigen isoform X1 [Lepisosteus oculatus]